MMFYGRTAYTADDDDMLKSAILVTKALKEDAQALSQLTGLPLYNVWRDAEAIYNNIPNGTTVVIY